VLRFLESRLGLLLAGVLGARLLRRSALRNSPRPKAEAFIGAERINARIAAVRIDELEDARRRQRRRLAAITAFIVLVGALGGMLLSRRPPIEFALRTSLPSAHSSVAFTGLSNQSPPRVRSRLHTLILHSHLVRSASGGPSDALELVLPVRRQACRRLVEQLGGGCGDERGGARRIQPPMIITWPRQATVTLDASAVRRFDLIPPAVEAPRHPLSNWTAETNASRLHLQVDCAGRSPVTITRPGMAPIRTPCIEARPIRWRISLALSGGRALDDLELIGLSSFHAHVAALHVHLSVNQALARLGDSFRRLEARRGVPVEIGASDEDPITTDLAITRLPHRSDLSLGTTAASSVHIAQANAIPTTFHRNREIWLPVIFALAGALVTAWLDRWIL
jgi:hypothetical protein